MLFDVQIGSDEWSCFPLFLRLQKIMQDHLKKANGGGGWGGGKGCYCQFRSYEGA